MFHTVYGNLSISHEESGPELKSRVPFVCWSLGGGRVICRTVNQSVHHKFRITRHAWCIVFRCAWDIFPMSIWALTKQDMEGDWTKLQSITLKKANQMSSLPAEPVGTNNNKTKSEMVASYHDQTPPLVLPLSPQKLLIGQVIWWP